MNLKKRFLDPVERCESHKIYNPVHPLIPKILIQTTIIHIRVRKNLTLPTKFFTAGNHKKHPKPRPNWIYDLN